MEIQKYRNVATWIMMLIIILLAMYLVWFVNNESHKCLNNPYTYSIKLLEKANRGNVSCMCVVIKEGETVPFGWDRKGFKLEEGTAFDSLLTGIK